MKKIFATIIVTCISICMFMTTNASAACSSFEESLPDDSMTADIEIVELDLDPRQEAAHSESHPADDPYNPYSPFYDTDIDIVCRQYHGGEYLHFYAAHGYTPVGYTGFFIDGNFKLNRVYVLWTGEIMIVNDESTVTIPYGEEAVFDLVSGEHLRFFTEEVGKYCTGIPQFNVSVSRYTDPIDNEDGTAMGGAITLDPVFIYGFAE